MSGRLVDFAVSCFDRCVKFMRRRVFFPLFASWALLRGISSNRRYSLSLDALLVYSLNI
jgi:hypothetical protein